jgi:AcrR family transcriptional regulator
MQVNREQVKMARRSNAQLSEATRGALLESARAAFAEHGFADAPLEDLLRDTGLSKGALYHHFGSKQGLFIAVVQAIDAQIVARIRAAVPEHAVTRAAFIAACRIYLQATLEPGVRRILLLDCPAVLGYRATRELDAQTSIKPIAEVLVALAAAGEVGEIDAEATAHLINGALYDAALWIGDSKRPRQALDRAMLAFERLLSGLAPASRAAQPSSTGSTSSDQRTRRASRKP